VRAISDERIARSRASFHPKRVFVWEIQRAKKKGEPERDRGCFMSLVLINPSAPPNKRE